jgi:glycerophosphoryl diester phosphodiesterase
MQRRSWAALALALCTWPAIAQQAAPAAPAARAFDLQGHRGARALLPENSLAGFARALSIGVTTLELDIAITKDGVLAVTHDRTLSPDITRGPDGQFLAGRGPAIVTMTYADLLRHDVGRIKPGTKYATDFAEQQAIDGTRIPTLQQVFDLVKKSGNTRVRFAIETKLSPTAPEETVGPEAFAKAVIEAIRAAGMQNRSSILSFDWRTLKIVQREAPEIETVFLTSGGQVGTASRESPWLAGMHLANHGGSVPRMIKAAGGHTWSSNFNDLSPEKVKEAQALGLKVLAWTINDAPTMAKFMDWGVDGIVTDRPDLLRAEMQKRGMPVPEATPVVP